MLQGKTNINMLSSMFCVSYTAMFISLLRLIHVYMHNDTKWRFSVNKKQLEIKIYWMTITFPPEIQPQFTIIILNNTAIKGIHVVIKYNEFK